MERSGFSSIEFTALLVLLTIVLFGIFSYPGNGSKAAASVEPKHVEPSPAEIANKQKGCDKFIKLAFRNGVIGSYRGPLVTVGPQWYGLPFEDKSKIASALGNCIYLGQDSSLKILGFMDYYTGKRIGHLDVDGNLATD